MPQKKCGICSGFGTDAERRDPRAEKEFPAAWIQVRVNAGFS